MRFYRIAYNLFMIALLRVRRGRLPGFGSEVHLERRAALGDVLMCTPALRELKLRNPGKKIVFYTFPEYFPLLEALPFIDELRDPKTRPQNSLHFYYGRLRNSRRHIVRIFGDRLGINIEDVRPSISLDEGSAAQWRGRFAAAGKPVVVISRKSSGWTPNKDWPDRYWEELVQALAADFHIVEIGTAASERSVPGSHEDLRGKTTLPELTAIIAAADLHVGPISGPVHIAAAVGTPSVVIYGGYEHPDNTAYPGNTGHFTPVPCAPCWLDTACPYDKKCLRQIEPAAVYGEVCRMMKARQAALDR